VSAARELRIISSTDTDLASLVLGLLPGTSVIAFDPDLRVTLVSGEAFASEVASPRELEGQHIKNALDPDRLATYEPLFRSALCGESRTQEIWSKDERICHSVQVRPLRGEDEQLIGGVGIFEDITRRKHADELRRHTQDRFELMFDNAPIGMALLTAEQRVVRANQALLTMTGYGSQQLHSKTLSELTHPDDLLSDGEQLRRLLAGEIAEYEISKRYMHARGHVISAMLTLSLVRDAQDKPLHFIAQIQDLTEQRLIEQRLAELDERDPLTGLLTRKCFEQHVSQRVSSSAQTGEPSALLVLNLDDFRQLNETYGHKMGDELLRKISSELSRRLRGTDLIARLGGDEFGVLLAEAEPKAADAVARDLVRVLEACAVEVPGDRASSTASYGVAPIGQDTGDEDAVLITAERAMRAAKRSRGRELRPVEPKRHR
jgi:diguanylate cyclase (GGDEF)-like protein/PAS domain S-box-containing protein